MSEPNLESGRNRGTTYDNHFNSIPKSSNNDKSKHVKAKRWSYRPIKVLGHGTFGIVIHAKVIETNEDVAIKRIRYDGRLHNRELIIMQKISQQVNSKRDNTHTTDCDSKDHTDTITTTTTTTTTTTATIARVDNHRESPTLSSVSALSVIPTPSLSHLGCVFDYTSKRWLLCVHPHVVQLRTFYFTNDTESGESFLHLVLSYLPTDLYQVKRQRFTSLLGHQSKEKFQEGDTRTKIRRTLEETPEEEEQEQEWEHNHSDGSEQMNVKHTSPIDCINTTNSKDMILWCKVIIFQLARALAFLHARHICHRDVKPANVFIDPQSGRVQLGDYGSAKEIVHPLLEKNVSYICSRYYRAPELLFGALHYTYAVDMWSLGCIIAELLRPRGAILFRGITTIDQLAEIVKVIGSPPLEDVYLFNPSCAEAMKVMHENLYKGQYNTKNTSNCTFSVSAGMPKTSIEKEIDNKSMTNSEMEKEECSNEPLLQQEEVEKCHDEHNEEEQKHQTEEEETPHSLAELSNVLSKMSGSVLYDVMKIPTMPWHEVLYTCTPASGIDLVSKLLKYTPSERLTAAEVVEHAFFNDLFVDIDKINKQYVNEEATHADNAEVNVELMGSDTSTTNDELNNVPRLPNGNVLPIEMFLLTHDEQKIYSKRLQKKMWQTALAIHAASS